MKATVSFYGCSCGCTPGEDKDIVSDTQEGLIYGVADTMNNYRVYGNNPYRKCRVEIKDGDIPYSEIETMAQKIWEYEERINSKKAEMEKPFCPPYKTSSDKDFPIPEELMRINEIEKEKNTLKKHEIQKEIDAICIEKQALYRDFDVIDPCEEQW